MNVIAWELGGKITDFPDGIDPVLAKVVQMVNDAIAIPTTPKPVRPEPMRRFRMIHPETVELYQAGGPPSASFNMEVEMTPVSPAEMQAYDDAMKDWQLAHEVPAKFSGRLLDIAHQTLGTKPGYTLRTGDVHEAWRTFTNDYLFAQLQDTLTRTPRSFPGRTREERQDSQAEALIEALDRSVRLYRMRLGLSEYRSETEAPSVAVINDALRRMHQTA